MLTLTSLVLVASLAAQSSPASPPQPPAPAGDVLAADTPRTTIVCDLFGAAS